MATPEEIVRMQWDNFNNRTYRENATRYVSPDAVFVDGPTGEESYGVEGFIQVNDMWSGALSDAHVDVVSVETDGGTAFTTFTARGTFDGQLPGPDGEMIEGTGGKLNLEFSSETEVVDGMIVRDVTTYDMEMFMSQLGLH